MRGRARKAMVSSIRRIRHSHDNGHDGNCLYTYQSKPRNEAVQEKRCSCLQSPTTAISDINKPEGIAQREHFSKTNWASLQLFYVTGRLLLIIVLKKKKQILCASHVKFFKVVFIRPIAAAAVVADHVVTAHVHSPWPSNVQRGLMDDYESNRLDESNRRSVL